MNFLDKFKKGDIICSDNFRSGLCMIVENKGVSNISGPSYTCVDLMAENNKYPQKWIAKEFGLFTKPNNWRIATDDDVVNYMLRYFHPIKEGDNKLSFNLNEEFLTINTYGDKCYLNMEEIPKLKDYLIRRLGER